MFYVLCCVLWAMLPESNKMMMMNAYDDEWVHSRIYLYVDE